MCLRLVCGESAMGARDILSAMGACVDFGWKCVCDRGLVCFWVFSTKVFVL